MTTYYSDQHEWLSIDGDTATLGITEHAAEQLGDVVFVEQQDVGESFEAGDEIGVIESVKAASELYAPVTGEIIEVNELLVDSPESINDNPESDAWIYKIRIEDSSQLEALMDKEAYMTFIDE